MLLIIGDSALDRWVDCGVVGVSREAPVVTTASRPGAAVTAGAWAANLAVNCANMGLDTWLLTAYANDTAGAELSAIFLDNVVKVASLEGVCVRTGQKTRHTVQGHIASRHDVLPEYNMDNLFQAVRDRIADLPAMPRMIAVSDNGSGLITAQVAQYIATFAKTNGICSLVDTRAETYAMYAEVGFDIIRINLPDAMQVAEAEGWLVAEKLDAPTQASELSAFIARDPRRQASTMRWAVVTAGEHGAVAHRGQLDDEIVRPAITPKYVHGVRELSGAGDTYTAALLFQLMTQPANDIDWDFPIAAASCAVMRPGTGVVSLVEAQDFAIEHAPNGYLKKLVSMTNYNRWRWSRSNGTATIGLASGCFDGLHAGHFDLLEFAKQHCDKLVVAINDDESLRKVKGDDRPRIPLDVRVKHLCMLPYVSRVVIFDGDVDSLLYRTQPHVYVKGQDTIQEYGEVPGLKALERINARLMLCPTDDRYFVLKSGGDESGQSADSSG